jgi:hypothetical protein
MYIPEEHLISSWQLQQCTLQQMLPDCFACHVLSLSTPHDQQHQPWQHVATAAMALLGSW